MIIKFMACDQCGEIICRENETPLSSEACIVTYRMPEEKWWIPRSESGPHYFCSFGCAIEHQKRMSANYCEGSTLEVKKREEFTARQF